MVRVTSRSLFELVDLIHAVGRQLPPPKSLEPGTCTFVEIQVMRAVSQNPGSSAQAISSLLRLPSSNFARLLRSLEKKGLIEKKADSQDARVVRLFLTNLANENFKRMEEEWSGKLSGIITDQCEIDRVNSILHAIEKSLIDRQTK